MKKVVIIGGSIAGLNAAIFAKKRCGKQMEHNGRINGLDNIHLSGQWLQPPGGLPEAVITGKDTIMRICKQEKRPFSN